MPARRSKGIKTLEDLAEQAIDDLLDLGIDAQRAGDIIMEARNLTWFKDEYEAQLKAQAEAEAAERAAFEAQQAQYEQERAAYEAQQAQEQAQFEQASGEAEAPADDSASAAELPQGALQKALQGALQGEPTDGANH